MNIEKMREEFEARYPLATGCIFHEGKYGFWIDWGENEDPEFSMGMGLTQMRWEAWQASRAAIEVELPSSKSAHNQEVIKAVGRYILSQGLKVKPCSSST